MICVWAMNSSGSCWVSKFLSAASMSQGGGRVEQEGWCGYLVRYETEVDARRAMHKIDPTVRCVVKSAQTMMQGTRDGIDAYFIFGGN